MILGISSTAGGCGRDEEGGSLLPRCRQLNSGGLDRDTPGKIAIAAFKTTNINLVPDKLLHSVSDKCISMPAFCTSCQ